MRGGDHTYEPPADRRTAALTFGVLTAIGSPIALVNIFVADSMAFENRDLAIGTVAVGVLVGLVVLAMRDRISTRALALAVAVDTILVTGLIHTADDPTGVFPLLYTWLGLFSFYFFSRYLALAEMAVIGIGYAAVLALNAHPTPVPRWLLVIGTPLVTGILITRLVDQVRRKAAQAARRAEELHESEERTRKIIETANDAFVALDEDGRITNWNPRAQEMFGWTREEVVGEALAELAIPEGEHQAHHDRRTSFLEGGQRNWPVELTMRDRSGREFPVRVSVSPLKHAGKWYFNGFIQDISRQREAERERAQLAVEQSARAEAEAVAKTIEGLQRVTDAALLHMSVDDLLAELLDRLGEVLGLSRAAILLPELEPEDTLVVRATIGAPAGLSIGDVARPGQGLAGRVALEQRLLFEKESDGDRVRINFGLPLKAHERVAGVLQLEEPERGFSDQEIALLQLAADRVALAIDHARVFEREHRIAVSLQRSLLPEHLPEPPGLAVAARYLPAVAEAEVGGDWYDVITLPGGQVGVALGDVAGKGLAAATMVGELRNTLRAYAMDGHGPGAVLERVNALLAAEGADGKMATLVFAVIDAGGERVRFANAGHLPPVLLPAEGSARFLAEGHSVPLGVMPFASFEETCVTLEDGSTLLLVTDGLVERRGSNIEAGLLKLAATAERASRTPEVLCDTLVQALVPGGATDDDIAILAVQSRVLTDKLRIELPSEPASLASMRGLLGRWLEQAQPSSAVSYQIMLAADEACTNAIEHAHPAGDEPFEVEAVMSEEHVGITIRDRGVWRPERADDAGRGLELMRALMDEVEVDAGPGGTTVYLRRCLSEEASV